MFKHKYKYLIKNITKLQYYFIGVYFPKTSANKGTFIYYNWQKQVKIMNNIREI